MSARLPGFLGAAVSTAADAVARPMGGLGGLLGALYGVTSDADAGYETVVDPVTRKVIRRRAIVSPISLPIRAVGYGAAGAILGGLLGRSISRLPMNNSTENV